jgi:predicted nucleic acid-binding protein
MPIVLADTTVLNNFAQVERPDLLRKAFSRLCVPPEVRAELEIGERRGLVPVCDWTWLTVIESTGSERSHASALGQKLQAGEAACISILVARGGLLLTDDGPARHVAAALGLELSGTIGALVNLLRRKTLSLEEGDALLHKMIARGYRSPIQSLRAIGPEP